MYTQVNCLQHRQSAVHLLRILAIREPYIHLFQNTAQNQRRRITPSACSACACHIHTTVVYQIHCSCTACQAQARVTAIRLTEFVRSSIIDDHCSHSCPTAGSGCSCSQLAACHAGTHCAMQACMPYACLFVKYIILQQCCCNPATDAL